MNGDGFGGPTKLQELVEELAELSLEARRSYIADIESANGKESADQIRAELKRIWEQRDR